MNIFTIILILLTIIIIPIFLDIVMRISVRHKKRTSIYFKSLQKARRKNKPLLILSYDYNILIKENELNNDRPIGEKINEDVITVLSKMKDNSVIICVIEILEYYDNPNEIWQEINRVSGGKMYSFNLDKMAPKLMFDYRIKNVMNKEYYNSDDMIIETNKLKPYQLKSQEFYKKIFMFVPNSIFLSDPMKI